MVSPQNAERVLRSLEVYGFSGLGLTKDDFIKPDSVIQLGYPPYRASSDESRQRAATVSFA